MIFTLTEVMKLKNEVKSRFSADIHFHDACSGQSFSIDKNNDELKKYILKYCSERNLKAVFSKDGLRFTIEKETVK